MSESRHQEKLLNEVLAEAGAPGFREALLEQTLGLARRRRRFRQVRKLGLGVAVVALGALLLWRNIPLPSRPGESPKPYELVRTAALPQSAIVRTRALAPGGLVASVPVRDVVITSARPANALAELTDDELLALVGPGAAVLVRHGPHSAELVFLNPAPRESPAR